MPIGTIIGLIGLGISLYSFFANQASSAAALELQEEAYLTDLQAQQASTKQQILEAEGKRKAYQDLLAKLPTAGQSLTETTGDPDIDRAYRELLSNFGTMNVMAGATGQVGPGTSMSLLQEQAGTQMSSFVTFQKDLAQKQVEQFQATLDILNPTLTTLEDQIAKLEAKRLADQAQLPQGGAGRIPEDSPLKPYWGQ
jgi:flagellar biosynthesis chaperone FliJ